MRRVVASGVLLGLLAGAGLVWADRLPTSVVPVHYDLVLQPDLAAAQFVGSVGIEVSVQRRTSEILLHAVDLEISEASVEQSGHPMEPQVVLQPDQQRIRLDFEEPLQPGPARIFLRFDGHLDDSLRGFYRGSSNGKTYAATQFEATEARRAFPCFDEPRWKATFSVALVTEAGLTALSNGAVVETSEGPEEGLQTVRFATTPRLPTYLVAFAVGDFACLEGGASGIPIRVCADPARTHLGHYALEVSEWLLPYFEETFGVSYPFDKLDHLAVADFEAGAMENAAAIFYRETALLVDDTRSAFSERQRVAKVVAHEIAHQWFGDLVTMRWWDDLWLKEGFADFMEMESLGVWKPSWEPELESVRAMGWPLSVDTLAVARAVRSEAETPDEINALFDGLSYGKASAVLRMLQAYLGREVMQQGVESFLQQHAFGEAQAADFVAALSEAAQLPAGAVMESFLLQPGVPRVRYELRCDGESQILSLRQDRFFVDGRRLGSEPERRWSIPICREFGDCVLLDQLEQEVRFAGCEEPWVLNPYGRGYFVSQPTAELLEELAAAMSDLRPVDRLVLVRDEWLLLRSGERAMVPFLGLLDATRTESEPAVIEQVLRILATLEQRLVDEGVRSNFERWMGAYLGSLLDTIGWSATQGESERTSRIREELLQVLGELAGDPRVVEPAVRLAQAYLAGLPVDPNAVQASLRLAARFGEAELYDRIVARLQNARTPQEAAVLLSTLGAFRQPELIDRTLTMVLSDAVRSQDLARVLGGFEGNPVGQDRAWDAVRLRWDDFLAKVPAQARPFFLPQIGRIFCQADDVAEFEDFARDKPFNESEMEQTRELVRNCVEFRVRHRESFADWLADVGAGT